MKNKSEWTLQFKAPDQKKPSILLISITSPIPSSSGGARAVAHSVLPLANEYNFHLLLVGNTELSDCVLKHVDDFKNYFISVSYVRRTDIPQSLFSKGIYFLERLIWELPFLDINFYSSSAIRVAKKIISKYRIDLLELNTSHVAYFKFFFPGIPSLLMSQNIESELFPFWDRPCPRPLKPFYDYMVRKSRTSAYEVEILNKWHIEKMAFVSREDMNKVSSSINKTVLSVSFDSAKRQKKEHSSFNVTWVGTFDWAPNVEAMEWFADNIFPLVKEKLKQNNIHINVVGINPTEKILRLSSHSNVFVLGFVENLDQLLDETDLSIAPIQSGAGIKVKVVEAMSRGIPVLCTTKGAIGTGLKNNESAFISDDPSEFARILLDAPSLKALLADFSNRSRQIFESDFSTDKALMRKRELYSELLDPKRTIDRSLRKGLPPLIVKAVGKVQKTIKKKLRFVKLDKESVVSSDISPKPSSLTTSPYYGLTVLKPITIETFNKSFSSKDVFFDFSVVICVKNEEDNLQELFSQLDSQTYAPTEIIFIDHFSTDRTRSLIENYQKTSKHKVRLYSSEESLQFRNNSVSTLAGNRNFGLSLANCPNILFMDAGNDVDENFFMNMIGPALKDSSVDLVGGIYCTQSKVLDELFTYKWEHVDFKNFIPACRALLVKKNIALACGGFVEQLNYACEDVCFCIAYRKLSRKWAFSLSAKVVWAAPATREEMWKKFTSYGIGAGESGFSDFDNYQNYIFFNQEGMLPKSMLDVQILPPLFYGSLMGRRLRGEFDKKLKTKNLVILLIDKSLYFSPSSREIVKKKTKENSRVIVISETNLEQDVKDKVYLEAPCWQVELIAMKDFDIVDLVSRYGWYFTSLSWEIILDKNNASKEVTKNENEIRKKLKMLFNR